MGHEIIANADMHIGREPAMQEAFDLMVERIHVSSAQVVILNGDIFDKRATISDINHVVGALDEVKKSGKEIIYVAGNHEERLSNPPWEQVKALLKHIGVTFLEPDNPRFVYTSDTDERIAFVGMPCVLPVDEMKKISYMPVDEQPALIQKRLEELYADKFIAALNESQNEDIPTIVIFHVPPFLEPYGKGILTAPKLHIPGKFAEALDPTTVLLILHGHLHGEEYPGIGITYSNGIVVINDGKRQEATDMYIPSCMQRISQAEKTTGRRANSH